jgi:hypothetical protein
MSKNEKSGSKIVKIDHGEKEPSPGQPGGFKTRTVQKGDDSVTVKKDVANTDVRKK